MTLNPRTAEARAIAVACDRLALAEEIALDPTAVGLMRQGRYLTRPEQRALLFANAFWAMALREEVVMRELKAA